MSVSRRSFVASLAFAGAAPAFGDAPYPDKP
jgi:hypothetical protein